MPTYEYLCQTCRHRFETWQKMTDEPLTVCPECGGHIRKVFYPAGIVFKGSGFYKTDHRSDPVPVAEGAKKTDGETPKTDGVAATETKPSSTESKTSDNGSKSSESKSSESKVTTPTTS